MFVADAQYNHNDENIKITTDGENWYLSEWLDKGIDDKNTPTLSGLNTNTFTITGKNDSSLPYVTKCAIAGSPNAKNINVSFKTIASGKQSIALGFYIKPEEVKFQNEATVKHNNTIIKSNIVFGKLITNASIEQDALQPEYKGNQDITFIVKVDNNTTNDLVNLTIIDNMGEYIYEKDGLQEHIYPLEIIEDSIRFYINGVRHKNFKLIKGPPMQLQNISMPKDSNLLLLFDTKVKDRKSVV